MVTATGNETTNGVMTLVNDQSGAMAVYGRIKDPMEFINGMGKVFALAGACGVKTENEGKVLALACMCKGKDPFELQEDYHIIEGKLSMRADAMLAKFRERGGKHRWVKDGKDGVSAELELIDRDGMKVTSTFTIKQAQEAGYIRKGSNWEKRPDQQLRARCTSDGIRMIAPEVISGRYTPEELDDSRVVDTTATTVTPVRSAEEVEARRRELQGQATNGAATSTTTAVQSVATDPNVIDVTLETIPFDPTPDHTSPATTAERIAAEKKTLKLAEIQHIAEQFSATESALIAGINKQDGTNYATLDDLPDLKADAILERLRQKLHAKNNPPTERQPGEEG
jgi:hypothetical protein